MKNTNKNPKTDKYGRTGELVKMSPNQMNPCDAKAEDFEVRETDAKPLVLPFDGHCGDTPREYRALLAERDKHGKSKPSTED